ncbi:DUF1549 domain-containing protein [Thalassoglobus neptunius]|nr:DUF1549 domain-containing protein [Thalassoglobus neptunius]
MSHLSHRCVSSFSKTLLLVFGVCLSANLLTANATEPAPDPLPLHVLIDSSVESVSGAQVAPPVDDATFVRRVHLDLIGRIPTVDETRDFLADSNPDKRDRLVNDLVNRTEFVKNLAARLDIMLMERRGGKHVSTLDFRAYLEQSISAGKSYREIVSEVLGADGTDEKVRPASAFFLERDVDPTLLTREIGRVFFGVDLQCAQCHDHPNIDDYYQEDYYGLQAFVIRAKLFQPDKKKPALIAESAEGEASFRSVFTDRQGNSGPRLLNSEELGEVILKPGENYQIEPAKNVRPVPVQSRIELLSELVSTRSMPMFDRNIANRLWKEMFGIGLVEPVDLHHSGNPPTNPELLELLAEQFAAMDHDIGSFIREIALSQTYQRSHSVGLPGESVDTLKDQISELESTAKQEKKRSYEVDKEVDQKLEDVDVADEAARPLRKNVADAKSAVATARSKFLEAETKLKQQQVLFEKTTAEVKALREALEKAQQASELLKENSAITDATATFATTLTQTEEKIPAIEGAVQTAQSELTQTKENLETARSKADEAIAALTPAEEKIRTHRAEAVRLRQLASDHRQRSELARQQIDWLEQAIQVRSAYESLASTNSRIKEIEAQLAQTQSELDAKSKESESTQKQLIALASRKEQLNEECVLLREKLVEAQRVEQQVSESLAQVGLAAQFDSLSSDLDSARLTLNESQSLLQRSNESLAKKLKILEQAERQAVHSEEDCRKTLNSLDSQIDEMKNSITSLQADLELQRQKVSEQTEELARSKQTWSAVAGKQLLAVRTTPLSAEQLAWSFLTATGHRFRQSAIEAARIDEELRKAKEAKSKAGDEKSGDSEEGMKEVQIDPQVRQKKIEQATQAALTKDVATIAKFFASEAGQSQYDFFATPDQALFLSNGNELRHWLTPGNGNLTDRLNRSKTSEEIATELYLSVFCRPPTSEEQQAVVEYIQDRAEDRPSAVQELAWAFLTSAEFRFRY